MIVDLKELYHEQLREILCAKSQMVATLPEYSRLAGSRQLRDVLNRHLSVTRAQRQQLLDLLAGHGLDHGSDEFRPMRGLIRGAKLQLARTLTGPVREAVLIASAIRLEHLEIACCESGRLSATRLGLDDDAQVLLECLLEDHEAVEKLTTTGTESISPEASHPVAHA
ncbi:ferritin-like domain-containing protein [Luteolibacter marinus]|uniref:YciE/YciF ferroxidase family protein n=1 Tax=Luteolibacter marinus TaxID=2776705 RepID=UPI0018672697|nr:DUF892 family protein [Luteolibacter marinus]